MINQNQMTEKSIEAIQNASNIAANAGSSGIEQAHLLKALTDNQEGLIYQLLSKMEISIPNIRAEVQHIIDGYPKVSGSSMSGNIYITKDTENALDEALSQAGQMKDEYVSVEHLMLGIIVKADRLMSGLFRDFNITKERFLEALAQVRGSQRVTSQHPEETYDVLIKYGQELYDCIESYLKTDCAMKELYSNRVDAFFEYNRSG